jgi:hypothetical protein
MATMATHSNANHSAWAVVFSAFAGILLIMIGIFHALAGVVAIANDTFFVVGREWIFEFDVTAWGWIHLIGGIIVVASGFGILTGNVLARSIGVAVAVLSSVVNFAWLPYYPVWSAVMIALSVAVIWALTVHGRDIAASGG